MADDANEQTTPHWGTSAPDYEGEDPENEIELDPNMAELPLFAGLEAKKIFADIEKQREKLEKAQADYADHEERYKVMVEHLKNVRQEVQHTEGLASAKRAEVASEDHLAQMAKREAGRYRQELKREQQELEAIDSTLNALQNQVFGANEKMDGFKLQMNWNQEELEQWALASKQKEEDNLAIEKYTRADEAKINQLALQIEKLTKRDLEIQAQVEAEATETSSRQIELDRTAEEFRVLHAERQKLVQQWKETIEVAARRDQDITKTATEYVQQKQAKEVVDVDLKAAREDLDKVQALHTELQTEVTARERQLQARREFLLSEQERKKKLEEEIDIIKTELVRTQSGIGCLHAIDATRFHRTMPGVVSFSSLSCFGPRRGRRGASRVDGVVTGHHCRDPTGVYVVLGTPSTRCHIGPLPVNTMLRAGHGVAGVRALRGDVEGLRGGVRLPGDVLLEDGARGFMFRRHGHVWYYFELQTHHPELDGLGQW